MLQTFGKCYSMFYKIITQTSYEDDDEVPVVTYPTLDFNEGYVHYFDNDIVYASPNAYSDADEKNLKHFIPNNSECDTMKSTYESWCEDVHTSPYSDLINHLNNEDISLHKQDLYDILYDKTVPFETNLNKDMYFTSSLGFKSNGDRRSKSNLQDLVLCFDLQQKDGMITYIDYDNVGRQLTKTQVQTLFTECVANGQLLYNQKWAYKKLIDEATSLDDLSKIDIVFKMGDFSNAQS